MADPASIYRSLAALHRAGIGWPAALASAAPGPGPWADARARAQAGQPLSQALHGVVPAIDLALVRAAEASGTLEVALESLSRRHEEAHRARGQRRAALAYPLMVAHVAAFLMPLPELMLHRTGAAVLWFLMPLVPIYAFWLYARRRPSPDRPLPYRFPFTARVEEQDAEALEALGTLYDAGVHLDEAVPLARAAGPDGRVARDLTRAAALVADGRPLAEAWRDVPTALGASLRSAELAGALGKECRTWSERLRSDADLRRKRTLARGVPLLMLGIGLLVAVRVLGFYANALARAGLTR